MLILIRQKVGNQTDVWLNWVPKVNLFERFLEVVTKFKWISREKFHCAMIELVWKTAVECWMLQAWVRITYFERIEPKLYS